MVCRPELRVFMFKMVARALDDGKHTSSSEYTIDLTGKTKMCSDGTGRSTNQSELLKGFTYLREIADGSGLELLPPDRVRAAFDGKDNGAGNMNAKSAVERYSDISPELRTPVVRVFGLERAGHTAKTLWSAVAAQKKLKRESSSERRLLFTDNYYTSKELSRGILQLSDGEFRIVDTMCMNYVDGGSQTSLQKPPHR
eukprot:IDg14543t1